jgi:methionyl-tRNA synthetase
MRLTWRKKTVPFHTLYFPGYLIGTGERWTMLNSLSTTGSFRASESSHEKCTRVNVQRCLAMPFFLEYLQYEDTKFSKSRNIGVFGENARETGIPPDVWRYYLLSNRPETSDSYFFWHDFVARNNSELLNNFGNFVNRAIKFLNAKYDSVLPSPGAASAASSDQVDFDKEDAEFVSDVNKLLASYTESMESLRLRAALTSVLHLSARGNAYLQASGLGNELFASNPTRCAFVLLTAANLIYLLSVVVHPFMPATSDGILSQLNAPERSLPDTFTLDLLPGHKLGQASHLFKRIDPANIEVWRAQYGGIGAKKAEEDTPAVSKKQQQKKKKAAATQAETPVRVRPEKTPEEVGLEEEVAQQGQKVRKVKAGEEEGDVAEEVKKLQGLKGQLADLVARLDAVHVTEAKARE